MELISSVLASNVLQLHLGTHIGTTAKCGSPLKPIVCYMKLNPTSTLLFQTTRTKNDETESMNVINRSVSLYFYFKYGKSI